MNTAKLTQGHEFMMRKTQVMSTSAISSNKSKAFTTKSPLKKKRTQSRNFSRSIRKRSLIIGRMYKKVQYSKIQDSIQKNLFSDKLTDNSRNETTMKVNKSTPIPIKSLKVTQKAKIPDFKVYDSIKGTNSPHPPL